MRKRSITVAGHRTSISLEEAFWQALAEIAAARRVSLAGLVVEIDRARPAEVNLSSAVRLFVLDWYRSERPA
jgi:predicted DNA-binding ribbon-helix-helix protein